MFSPDLAGFLSHAAVGRQVLGGNRQQKAINVSHVSFLRVVCSTLNLTVSESTGRSCVLSSHPLAAHAARLPTLPDQAIQEHAPSGHARIPRMINDPVLPSSVRNHRVMPRTNQLPGGR